MMTTGLDDSESCEIWEHLNINHLDQLQLRFLTATPTQYQDNSTSTGEIRKYSNKIILWIQ